MESFKIKLVPNNAISSVRNLVSQTVETLESDIQNINKFSEIQEMTQQGTNITVKVSSLLLINGSTGSTKNVTVDDTSVEEGAKFYIKNTSDDLLQPVTLKIISASGKPTEGLYNLPARGSVYVQYINTTKGWIIM